jgi:hypothetical protein
LRAGPGIKPWDESAEFLDMALAAADPAAASTRDRVAGLAAAAVARRYVVLGVTALVLWLFAGRGSYYSDWHFFVAGAASLTGSGGPGGGLHVYATHPYLQYGPLAMLFAVPVRLIGPDSGWALGSAICMALGVLTVWLVERAAVAMGAQERVRPAILLGGIFFLKAWCSPAVGAGHPDDVIALAAVAAAVLGVARGRWVTASVAIGCAAAAKPWALLAIALAAAVPGRRLRGLALAAAVAVVPWLPFVIADPRTADVGSFHLPVDPGSTLVWLGANASSTPGWPRLAQFLVAACLTAWALARGRWALIPVIAFAVRINLDPLVTSYYPAGVLLGTLVWDVTAPTRVPGARTVVAWVLLLAVPLDVYVVDRAAALPTVDTVLRLAVLVAPVLVLSRAGLLPDRLRRLLRRPSTHRLAVPLAD